jgi:dTDP-4-amino-4,6-dideoxygalactose transaminase
MSKYLKVDYVNLGLQFQNLKQEITDKFVEISSKGSYVLGEELKDFEELFSEYCGTSYAVGVGNGSDAIFFSLLALGIGHGDEVITTPNSFIATAWTIINIGAKPVFVDIGDDYNIDPNKIESAITSNTKAIIPVHLTGKISKMDEILEISKKHNLYVIEDSAQAVGATLNDKKAGSFGITGCFSLHPLKNLHVHGDGGMVTTNDKNIYNYLNKVRNHGLVNRDECEFWGYNSRLDEIQAAIGKIKLPYLNKWNEKSRKIAYKYTENLRDNVGVPIDKDNEKPVYQTYVINTDYRDELQNYLHKLGVETKIHYPIPIHLQESAKKLGYSKGDFPITEKQSSRILSLPIYPEMREDQIDHVIKGVNAFF